MSGRNKNKKGLVWHSLVVCLLVAFSASAGPTAEPGVIEDMWTNGSGSEAIMEHLVEVQNQASSDGWTTDIRKQEMAVALLPGLRHADPGVRVMVTNLLSQPTLTTGAAGFDSPPPGSIYRTLISDYMSDPVAAPHAVQVALHSRWEASSKVNLLNWVEQNGTIRTKQAAARTLAQTSYFGGDNMAIQFGWKWTQHDDPDVKAHALMPLNDGQVKLTSMQRSTARHRSLNLLATGDLDDTTQLKLVASFGSKHDLERLDMLYAALLALDATTDHRAIGVLASYINRAIKRLEVGDMELPLWKLEVLERKFIGILADGDANDPLIRFFAARTLQVLAPADPELQVEIERIATTESEESVREAAGKVVEEMKALGPLSAVWNGRKRTKEDTETLYRKAIEQHCAENSTTDHIKVMLRALKQPSKLLQQMAFEGLKRVFSLDNPNQYIPQDAHLAALNRAWDNLEIRPQVAYLLLRMNQPHKREVLDRINRLRTYNDSKAETKDLALQALSEELALPPVHRPESDLSEADIVKEAATQLDPTERGGVKLEDRADVARAFVELAIRHQGHLIPPPVRMAGRVLEQANDPLSGEIKVVQTESPEAFRARMKEASDIQADMDRLGNGHRFPLDLDAHIREQIALARVLNGENRLRVEDRRKIALQLSQLTHLAPETVDMLIEARLRPENQDWESERRAKEEAEKVREESGNSDGGEQPKNREASTLESIERCLRPNHEEPTESDKQVENRVWRSHLDKLEEAKKRMQRVRGNDSPVSRADYFKAQEALARSLLLEKEIPKAIKQKYLRLLSEMAHYSPTTVAYLIDASEQAYNKDGVLVELLDTCFDNFRRQGNFDPEHYGYADKIVDNHNSLKQAHATFWYRSISGGPDSSRSREAAILALSKLGRFDLLEKIVTSKEDIPIETRSFAIEELRRAKPIEVSDSYQEDLFKRQKGTGKSALEVRNRLRFLLKNGRGSKAIVAEANRLASGNWDVLEKGYHRAVMQKAGPVVQLEIIAANETVPERLRDEARVGFREINRGYRPEPVGKIARTREAIGNATGAMGDKCSTLYRLLTWPLRGKKRLLLTAAVVPPLAAVLYNRHERNARDEGMTDAIVRPLRAESVEVETPQTFGEIVAAKVTGAIKYGNPNAESIPQEMLQASRLLRDKFTFRNGEDSVTDYSQYYRFVKFLEKDIPSEVFKKAQQDFKVPMDKEAFAKRFDKGRVMGYTVTNENNSLDDFVAKLLQERWRVAEEKHQMFLEGTAEGEAMPFGITIADYVYDFIDKEEAEEEKRREEQHEQDRMSGYGY